MTIQRKIIGDLHTHSTASDGDLLPQDVILSAQKAGLTAIALTDHDTLSGLIEAVGAAEKTGLECIPGIEISICFNRSFFKGTLHYLVYFSKDTLMNPDFTIALNQTLSDGRGEKLVKKRIERINQLFGPIGTMDHLLKQELTIQQIKQDTVSATRRHFALALKQYHDLKPDTINMIIGNNSPAYIPSGVDISQLKPLFSTFQLVKVLAHPAAGSYVLSGHYSEYLPPFETVQRLMPEFINIGLDGLEVFYPGHTDEHIQQLINMSKNNGLLVSGGSDFHDLKTRPIATAGVTQEELDALMVKIS